MENTHRENGNVELTPLKIDSYKEFFDRHDRNKDGKIPIDDFITALKSDGRGVPSSMIRAFREHFERAEENSDKIITYEEFVKMMESRQGSKYKKLFQSYIRYTVGTVRQCDTIDGEYEDEYSCFPPKLCMAVFSILEFALFFYDWVYYDGSIHNGSLAESLIYDPSRRIEAWRYVTYMFVHLGPSHLLVNLLVQILLGVPLEMVHGNCRVLCIYIAGVVAGSLGTSISDPAVFLAGASGGVYALMTAHIASILMNWKEMKFALHQCLVFGTLIFVDVGTALTERYSKEHDRIGYAAHFAGAVTGLLVGINVLRNLRVRSWEIKVWWISLVLCINLMLSAITINIAFPSYFPTQKG